MTSVNTPEYRGTVVAERKTFTALTAVANETSLTAIKSFHTVFTQ